MPYPDASTTAYDRPATGAFAVTPNDSADLPFAYRGVYVGGSGDLKVTLYDGDTVTFVSLAAGLVHPIRCVRVWSTGTTATSIIGIK
jgi:hypothetical protein